MTDTDTIPVSASVASTGKGIRYIGDYAYAYSGVLDLTSPKTALDFTSGAGYIVGKFEFNADFATGGGAAISVEIFLNNVQIIKEEILVIIGSLEIMSFTL